MSKEKVVPPTLLETTVVQYFVRVITNPALSTESIIDVIGILIPSPKYFHHIHIPSYRFVPSPIDCCVRVRGITSTINPIRTKRSTLESYIVIYTIPQCTGIISKEVIGCIVAHCYSFIHRGSKSDAVLRRLTTFDCIPQLNQFSLGSPLL